MPQPSELSLPPEIEVLLCCARNPSDSTYNVRLAEFLSGPVDWSLIIEQAKEHGLLPLLCEFVLRDSKLQAPAGICERLRDANRLHLMRSLLLTSELLRISDALRERQIPALFWKGPTLAQIAYGSPALRDFEDIDIVAPHRLMPQVYDLMNFLNYESKLPRDCFLPARPREVPGEYVFWTRGNQVLVEFHTECTLRHFPRPAPIEEMVRRSETAFVNGRDIQTFALSDNLLMLCVHGAKDFWSRLIWIADVAAVAEKLDTKNWQQLFAKTRKCDATRMLHLGLGLARMMFQTQMPSEVSQLVMQDRIALRIAAELRDELCAGGNFSRSILWRSRYRIAMVPGVASGVRYWLRLSTAPAEEDWDAAKSAQHSSWTRSLLRPLRLWRKYGGAEASQHLGSEDN